MRACAELNPLRLSYQYAHNAMRVTLPEVAEASAAVTVADVAEARQVLTVELIGSTDCRACDPGKKTRTAAASATDREGSRRRAIICLSRDDPALKQPRTRNRERVDPFLGHKAVDRTRGAYSRVRRQPHH